jgi:hypothetical protein
VWGVEGYGVCHYPVPVLTIEIVRRAGMRPVLSPLGDSCCYLLITLTPKIVKRTESFLGESFHPTSPLPTCLVGCVPRADSPLRILGESATNSDDSPS